MLSKLISSIFSRDILVVEPFYGGSHAQFIKVLLADKCIGPRIEMFTLPAKKWPWRARTSALHFMKTIPPSQSYRVLLSSSVLNLTELVAVRPDLAKLWKVVYFHENQLVYPIQNYKDRDFHNGYSNITTSLVADSIVFNSHFNMESFLTSIPRHLKLMPDRPKDLGSTLEAEIRPKCRVIYFPVDFQTDNDPKTIIRQRSSKKDMKYFKDNSILDYNVPSTTDISCKSNYKQIELTDKENVNVTVPDSILHIVWPHRWEHDKNPEPFFQALFQLMDEGYDFKVSVLGESYKKVPEIFNVAKCRLDDRVVAWGFQDKDTYRNILDSAHVVVSTANHEFFGVSMYLPTQTLEATSRGCFPLCPKRLVYPEIYPDECLYSTQAQLVKRLKQFCRRPDKIKCPKINLDRFTWKTLQKDYYEVLKCHS